MKPLGYCLFETTIGSCAIAWTESEDPRFSHAVARLRLPEATPGLTASRIARLSGTEESNKPPREIAEVIKRLRKHLRGEIQDLRDIAVNLNGAATFARQVYDAAREIPPGQTRSYGELASDAGRPGAARAVGHALGKNPISIIIPCHRILAAGGQPGGFSAHGGLSTKARLLAIEGATFGPPVVIKSQRDVDRAAKLLAAADPKLAPCMAKPITWQRRPAQSLYATLAEAIVHQQLAPKAASTILSRVQALSPGGTIPEPAHLLELSDQRLREAGLSGAKTASMKDLAAKTLDGTVPAAEKVVSMGDEAIIRRLTSIRGVGRWTVEMLLIFNLGRMDVFPVDDYALRRSLGHLYGMSEVPPAKHVEALGDRWRPYRTVVSLYLWHHLRTLES